MCEWVCDADSNPFSIIYIYFCGCEQGAYSKQFEMKAHRLQIPISFYFFGVSFLSMCVCVRGCFRCRGVIVIHIQIRIAIKSLPVLHGTSLETDSSRHPRV